VIKKSLLVLAIICALIGSIALAQEASKTDSQADSVVLKEFVRSGKIDGVTFNFVLLNNRTVETLFQGSGKYAIRARANMATTFYVIARPDKDITLDTKFTVEQDGKEFSGEPINIQSFNAGPVAKGTQIGGLFQLSQKIDLTHPFKIKGANNSSIEFKLSTEALKLIAN
jgi:hypothetical protein